MDNGEGLLLLDVEGRKGITSLAKGVDESVDKSLFPTIQRRPNGSFIVMVSPSSTGKKLDWLYAKDNKGMIIDYKQFQNKAENSYSNSISGQESDHHVHTLEIGTKSVPPYSLKREGSSLKVHPLVTDVTPYARMVNGGRLYGYAFKKHDRRRSRVPKYF